MDLAEMLFQKLTIFFFAFLKLMKNFFTILIKILFFFEDNIKIHNQINLKRICSEEFKNLNLGINNFKNNFNVHYNCDICVIIKGIKNVKYGVLKINKKNNCYYYPSDHFPIRGEIEFEKLE